MKTIFIAHLTWISIGLILMLSVSSLVTTEIASAAQDGDYDYVVGGEPATATIIGYRGMGGNVEIPSTLGGYPVTAIQSWAFYQCGSLTSVSIPNGVTSIGDYVFTYNYQLVSVTIAASVTFIGDGAFEFCGQLTSIVFLGSAAPFTGNNWVYGNSINIRGHAFNDSNFPAPGDSFNGLKMGELIPVGGYGSDDLLSSFWTAMAIVALIIVVIFLLFHRAGGRTTRPWYSRLDQSKANEMKDESRDQMKIIDQQSTSPSPHRNRLTKGQDQTNARCPWCGAQMTGSSFCSFCGGKLED